MATKCCRFTSQSHFCYLYQNVIHVNDSLTVSSRDLFHVWNLIFDTSHFLGHALAVSVTVTHVALHPSAPTPENPSLSNAQAAPWILKRAKFRLTLVHKAPMKYSRTKTQSTPIEILTQTLIIIPNGKPSHENRNEMAQSSKPVTPDKE